MPQKLKLNLRGFQALRTGPAATRLVADLAGRVASAAGDGFEAKPSPSRNRARAVVVPTTPDAARKTAQDPASLIAAMESARG